AAGAARGWAGAAGRGGGVRAGPACSGSWWGAPNIRRCSSDGDSTESSKQQQQDARCEQVDFTYCVGIQMRREVEIVVGMQFIVVLLELHALHGGACNSCCNCSNGSLFISWK
ncbi:unnamed protein product, partial [Heterosigma akashiwo]